MATLGKPQRQHRIARLLEEQAISSQAQLVEMLAADGVIATQATVSRDLEELGAVKVRIPGGAMAYAIPEHAKERTAPDDHLRRVMGEFVVEVAHSANLVVLRTPPGSAHVVASALDRAGLPDVLGTVAGDDTIILVCAEAAGGAVRRRRPRHPRRTLTKASERLMTKRVVLAYSGGLDTSVAVKWIQEEWGAEVVALAVDVGQQADDPWDEITARALAAGAVEARVVDARAEFADDYLVHAIHANALYEGKYPLVSALSRPVIAKHLVLRGPRVRRRRGRARLHRQGQRPGALRGVGARARARPRRARAGAGVGLHPRRQHRLRGQARHPDQRHQEEPVLDRREPLGPRHRVRHDRGPVGVAAARRLRAHARRRRRAERAARDRRALRAGRAGRARRRGQAAARARRSSSAPRSAPTAGVGSTWSRTAGSASRAARPTSARVRSRCCSRTPTSSRSRSSATSCARRPGSSRATPSSCTTASGSRRSRRRSTRSWATPSASSPARCACGSSPAAASSPAGAPTAASTATTSPPTTPPTRSATRTPPASSGCGASRWRRGPASRAGPTGPDRAT